jgi:hypothetical protein
MVCIRNAAVTCRCALHGAGVAYASLGEVDVPEVQSGAAVFGQEPW